MFSSRRIWFERILLLLMQSTAGGLAALGFTYKFSRSKEELIVSKIKPGGWAEKVCGNQCQVIGQSSTICMYDIMHAVMPTTELACMSCVGIIESCLSKEIHVQVNT
jgi:hypothetical protein